MYGGLRSRTLRGCRNVVSSNVAPTAQSPVLGVPTFFCYSVARLVVLAVIAMVAPQWMRFLHVYLLVLVNAGFLLWLWATWVNHLPDDSRP